MANLDAAFRSGKKMDVTHRRDIEPALQSCNATVVTRAMLHSDATDGQIRRGLVELARLSNTGALGLLQRFEGLLREEPANKGYGRIVTLLMRESTKQ